MLAIFLIFWFKFFYSFVCKQNMKIILYLFFLINILSIGFLIFYSVIIRKEKYIKNLPAKILNTDLLLSKISNSIIIRNSHDYTLRNPEWEQINKYTFFRRSSGYYFVDTLLMRLFFIVKSTSVLNNFTAELLIENNQNELISKLNLVNSSFTVVITLFIR